MIFIEGQEVLDRQEIPSGKHLAEDHWTEYGVRSGEVVIPCDSKKHALKRIDGRTAQAQLVERTVIALAWETATE